MRILRQGRMYMTIELAEMTVTMLLDGTLSVPPGALRPVRAFLVGGADGVLLIDSGAGAAGLPGLGRLGQAMAEAQTGPQEVDVVALTHMHAHHRGGLVAADGAPAFPNAARVFLATEELSAFRALPGVWPILPRLMPLEQGDGPLRGVTTINAPGHSPGHMAYLVEGRLLVWGDLVHSVEQFADPDLSSPEDADPEMARDSRRSLMEQAVEAGWLVAGAHLPDPGIGRIERDGAGYAFRPVSR